MSACSLIVLVARILWVLAEARRAQGVRPPICFFIMGHIAMEFMPVCTCPITARVARVLK